MKNINTLLGDYYLNDNAIKAFQKQLLSLKPQTFKRNSELNIQFFQYTHEAKANLLFQDFDVKPFVDLIVMFEIHYIKNNVILDKKQTLEPTAPVNLNMAFDTYVIQICNQDSLLDQVANMTIDDKLINRMCFHLIKQLDVSLGKRFAKSKFNNIPEMITFTKDVISNAKDCNKYYKCFLMQQFEKFEETLDVYYLFRANNPNLYKNIASEIVNFDKIKWMINHTFELKD